MIIKTKLIFEGFEAFTFRPFIFVHPDHANNEGLIAHEMTHYKEQWWIPLIWVARYCLSKKFKLAAEIRAYKAQIAGKYLTTEQAAEWLVKYDFNITYEESLKLLRDI